MVPYKLRYSRRVKRLRIEIAPRTVIAVAPYGTTTDTVDRFINRSTALISARQRIYRSVASSMTPVSYENCTELPVLGKTVVLPLSLWNIDNRERHVVKWLDIRLMHFLEQKMKKFEKQGLVSSKLRLGNPATLWGSCGRRGIMINRKLVHAPAEITEYVLVHELVHLVHGNHSTHFWGKVEQHMGNVGVHRKWLNLQGAFLMNGEVPVSDLTCP